MKRMLCMLSFLILLSGCAEQPEKAYPHVVEEDYISDTYYLTEIEPREPGDLEPTDYGVFEKDDAGAFRLLLNIGAYTDIYPARNRTLVRGHILYSVDGHDIVSHDLLAEDPAASQARIERFFPDEMEIIILNALNDTYVFVYAQLNQPIRHRVYSMRDDAFKPYLSYFSIRIDDGSFKEVSMEEIPVQKRQ